MNVNKYPEFMCTNIIIYLRLPSKLTKVLLVGCCENDNFTKLFHIENDTKR